MNEELYWDGFQDCIDMLRKFVYNWAIDDRKKGLTRYLDPCNFDYLLNKTEKYISKNKKKGDSYEQREMGDPNRKTERPKESYPQNRSMAERETDLVDTPIWWVQFRDDEDFKQKNPVLYTILEAFAKDEQRRYKEENEVFK